MRKNTGGFTLAELLIVVAVILVLVAIAFPIFAKFLETGREATDLANIRSAYAQVKADAIPNNRSSALWSEADGLWRVELDLEQAEDGWQESAAALVLSGIAEIEGTPTAKGKARVEYSPSPAAGKLNTTIRFDGPDAEPAIDYNSNQSIGKYVYSQVLKELALHESGQDSIFSNLFKKMKSDQTVTMTLPNGKTVEVIVYRRDYDTFQYINDRFKTDGKASLIYNDTTQKLTTVVYYENGSYSAWSVDGDYDAWSDDAAWKENAY